MRRTSTAISDVGLCAYAYQVVAGGEDVGLWECCHEWERVAHPHGVHVRHQDAEIQARERVDEPYLLASL